MNTFYELIGSYGLIAVFFLAMIEGDVTLLLAGVLAHRGFFGDYSFLKVLCFGTLGGVIGDNAAYAMGRGFGKSVRRFSFYLMARPRIERLTDKFGVLSIFLLKYVYGLRTAASIFWGMGHMKYLRFLLLSWASCFLWVFILSGAGYFFSGAITKLLGDFRQVRVGLLIIVVAGIAGFYLAERFWFSKKIELADPDRIQELEQAAQEKLHEIQERISFKHPHPRGQDSSRANRTASKRGPAEGD
jgi:membrane protein DedA with SNARE-associated domain